MSRCKCTANFRPINTTRIAQIFCGRYLADRIFNNYIFFHKYIYFFRHLELEIALAIPASSE